MQTLIASVSYSFKRKRLPTTVSCICVLRGCLSKQIPKGIEEVTMGCSFALVEFGIDYYVQ